MIESKQKEQNKKSTNPILETKLKTNITTKANLIEVNRKAYLKEKRRRCICALERHTKIGK